MRNGSIAKTDLRKAGERSFRTGRLPQGSGQVAAPGV